MCHYYCNGFYLFQGVNVDFPPSKLKQGFGGHAIFVLDHLADAALKSTNFAWRK
jgi:estrogen-related receptor beta like 1